MPPWPTIHRRDRQTGRDAGPAVAGIQGSASGRIRLQLVLPGLSGMGAATAGDAAANAYPRAETVRILWRRNFCSGRWLVATALFGSVGDPSQFQNGRQFAAWLGLTPTQRSSGGKAKLGGITKRGDTYLRTLLVQGARAVMR